MARRGDRGDSPRRRGGRRCTAATAPTAADELLNLSHNALTSCAGLSWLTSLEELDLSAHLIEAPKVVVATNVYQHAFAQFRNRVAPVWSYAMVTEPLSGEQRDRTEWPGREMFEEKRNLITIGRWTADGRIVWPGASHATSTAVT